MLLLCRSSAETAALLGTGVERHFLSNAGNGLDQDAFTVASPVGQRVEIAGFQARDWHGDDARILSDLTLEGETDSQRALAWSLPFFGEKLVLRPMRGRPFPRMLDRRPDLRLRGAQPLHGRQGLHPFPPGLHQREARVHRLALGRAPE
jgi:hypothetical protein